MSGSSFDEKPINVPGGPPRQPQYEEEAALHAQDRNPFNAPQGVPPRQPQEEAALHTQGRNAYNSERPLDVQPTQAGKCVDALPKSVTDLELRRGCFSWRTRRSPHGKSKPSGQGYWKDREGQGLAFLAISSL